MGDKKEGVLPSGFLVVFCVWWWVLINVMEQERKILYIVLGVKVGNGEGVYYTE